MLTRNPEYNYNPTFFLHRFLIQFIIIIIIIIVVIIIIIIIIIRSYFRDNLLITDSEGQIYQ